MNPYGFFYSVLGHYFGKNICVFAALTSVWEIVCVCVCVRVENKRNEKPTNRLSDCEISLIKRIYCAFITLY